MIAITGFIISEMCRLHLDIKSMQIGGYCTCCLSQQQLHFIIIWTFDVFLMMALTGVGFYAHMQAQTLPPAHLQKNQHEHVTPYGIIICVYMTYFNTCVSAPSE